MMLLSAELKITKMILITELCHHIIIDSGKEVNVYLLFFATILLLVLFLMLPYTVPKGMAYLNMIRGHRCQRISFFARALSDICRLTKNFFSPRQTPRQGESLAGGLGISVWEKSILSFWGIP